MVAPPSGVSRDSLGAWRGPPELHPADSYDLLMLRPTGSRPRGRGGRALALATTLATGLALTGCDVSAEHMSHQNDPSLAAQPSAVTTAIPPIDAAAPATFQTATFALG